jgi:hypothetical protein
MSPLEGTVWSAQLWSAPGADRADAELEPSPTVTTFLTAERAGFVDPVIATITNVAPDAAVATLQLRVWDNQSGIVTSFAEAEAVNAYRGRSPLFNVFAIGGGTNPAPELRDLQSFAILVRTAVRKGPIAGWGWWGRGAARIPAATSNTVAIAVGDYHNLALKEDGTVVAWGYDVRGQDDVPAGLSNVVSVAAGEYLSLALKQDGTVAAWGLTQWMCQPGCQMSSPSHREWRLKMMDTCSHSALTGTARSGDPLYSARAG